MIRHCFIQNLSIFTKLLLSELAALPLQHAPPFMTIVALWKLVHSVTPMYLMVHGFPQVYQLP